MTAQYLSLVVTTYNNADTLARCLQSADNLTDEIVVLDSYSSDNTITIARQFNASIQQQDFKGFGPQKHHAVSLASNDWVLLLDADEALSETLNAELLVLKKTGFSGAGYRLKRREWLSAKTPVEQYGRWQRHGVRLTDHLRLFNRREIHFTSHVVHAAPKANVNTPVLNSDLLHWGDAPFDHRLKKARHYAEVMNARSALPAASWFKKTLSPFWAFFQDYILRRYFLDGYLGFKAAQCSFLQAYWKYHNH